MAAKFYLCPKCGNVVYKFFDSGVGVDCCGGKMQEITPLRDELAMEKHLPTIELKADGTIHIRVGSQMHPMLDKHYIHFIFLETKNGGFIKFLEPGQIPEAVFCTASDIPVAVYAYCNIHGLWKKDV